MIEHALRLTAPRDLKVEIEKYSTENGIGAGIVLSGVGSLESAILRMAGAKETKTLQGPFEIVSLIGTISPDGLHLHASISDQNGGVIGGHVQTGCTIHTTVELILGQLENYEFKRVDDPQTGFKELQITKK